MKHILVLLALAWSTQTVSAQTLRLGEAPAVGVSDGNLAFYFGVDNGPNLFSAGEVRGRTIGKARINGTVYTLARTRRTERGDWTTSTFSGRGVTVEVSYRFDNAMGDEGGDCAHGPATLTVRQGRHRLQQSVSVAACPGDLF